MQGNKRQKRYWPTTPTGYSRCCRRSRATLSKIRKAVPASSTPSWRWHGRFNKAGSVFPARGPHPSRINLTWCLGGPDLQALGGIPILEDQDQRVGGRPGLLGLGCQCLFSPHRSMLMCLPRPWRSTEEHAGVPEEGLSQDRDSP